MTEFFPTPNQVLLAMLEAHGYPANIEGDRIHVAGHEPEWRTQIEVRSEGPSAQIKLDVVLHLPDGREVWESFAGIGREPKFAMGNAFQVFSTASFHVLLKAFFGAKNDVISEDWQFSTGRFQALLGDIPFRGQVPGDGGEVVEVFRQIMDGIKGAPLVHDKSHWIRLYYAQHERKPMVFEALLNSMTWEGAQKAMEHYEWVKSDAFYGARLFLVLLPLTD